MNREEMAARIRQLEAEVKYLRAYSRLRKKPKKQAVILPPPPPAITRLER